MLERGSKVYGCFLGVRKVFNTEWIHGLLYQFFSEFGIRERMWLATESLYTGVKAQVLYSGSLSRNFDVSQGASQGKYLLLSGTKFISIVYLSSWLNIPLQISINMLSIPSPSSANDISLLTTYPTFLSTFMNLCYEYSIKWRYEFHNDKSSIVTFGETKRIQFQSFKQRNWVLGNETVDERMSTKPWGSKTLHWFILF